MKLEDLVNLKKTIKTADLSLDPELLTQAQTKLAACRFYPSSIDGRWGPSTEKALAQFCKSVWLNCSTTGLWGATFAQELLEAEPPASKILTGCDYQNAARQLGVEVAAVKAVVDVECSGAGFLADGRVKILFEAHWFDSYTKGKFRRSHPNISSAIWNPKLYLGGSREYQRLELAKSLVPSAALMSTSFGIGQIMGFNYKNCGCNSVESFVADMQVSEGRQLAAMCEFIRHQGLVAALKKHDWNAFAYTYNGEAYRKNAYHLKLAAAYQKYLRA
jgi:hypothetical protein